MERTDFEQWKAKEVARLLALVETERRYYQEMVASLPVALVVLSADRSIVSANRAFRRTFGLRIEDLRRKTIDQILPAPALIERIRDVHMHGTALPHLFLNLDVRTLRIAIVPIRNWDEESEIETLLMVEDVSDFRHAVPPPPPSPESAPEPPPAPEAPPAEALVPEAVVPEALIEEPAPPDLSLQQDLSLPQDLALTIEVPAVVWQADASTFRFTSVSGAAEQMLGYPLAYWLTTPQFFRERIHSTDRAATMEFYESAIAREGDGSVEYRAVQSSGAVIWCRESIRVGPDGVITGILTDITLRRQLEEQLLTAKRSDALRGLASKLAHDLNNPLMIITGYGEEILQTLPPGDPMRGDVAQILVATERISGLTGQLLGYTRRLAGAPQPVNLLALLAGLEEKIAHAAGEAVAVEIHAESEPIWVLADAAQLSETILELVSPARTGTGDTKERSRIVISCGVETISEAFPEATLKPGLYARVILQDNGRGMDAATRQSAFESIFSGKEALARAYSNVREWGGDIAISSEPFRGSTFSIYLPYRVAPEPTDETPAVIPEPPATAPAPEPAPPPLETILLVEDEAGIRALVRKILRREHFDVIEAGTAEEALTLAAAYPGRIHLLLTDVILPGMGGRELAETMRVKSPDIKVLYVSGYTQDEAVRAGEFPPGSKFLQKPFTLSSLVAKVRETMAGSALILLQDEA